MRRRFPRFLLILISLSVISLCTNGAMAQFESLVQPPAEESAKEESADESKAQNTEAPATDVAEEVPAHLLTPRATMEHFLAQTSTTGSYASAIDCLDFSRTSPETQHSSWLKRELAWKLREVLDRLQVIDVKTISDDPQGAPFGIRPKRSPTRIVIDRGASGKWQFTPETVLSIDSLYEKLKDEPPVAGNNWLRDLFPVRLTQKHFLLPTYQWICLLVVIFAGLAADVIVRFFLHRATQTWLRFAKMKVDTELEKGVWKPVGLLARAITWYAGTVIIGLPPTVLDILLAAVQFFAVVAAVWVVFRIIDLMTGYFLRKAKGTDTKFDDLFIPLVSRSLKVFTACVGVIMFAETFDLPVAGLLSGLGIGGLAIAFAAKDTLSNVFGSLTVLVDRPFEIGDWIKTQDIEGSVETVGMRSTRVRTFYNSLISVPNSLLITAVVDNMGRRRYRRIKTMLGLQYDTPPDRLDAFCEGVRELIRRHPYTRKDYYHVYLNQFSASSLDVLLYCFLECPDWSVELRERHRLFVDILKLAEQLGISFAFPTRTLHLHEESASSADTSPLEESLVTGRRLAASLAGPPLPADKRPGLVEFPPPSDDDKVE